MDELGLEYTVISENMVHLFGEISVTALVLKLFDQKCEIRSIENHDATLESYYINLMGGADHV